MHTLKDAKIFVDSLNEDQKRALANGLLLSGRVSPQLIATRLCEAVQLARALYQVSQWKG